jgi:hypothetical protein
LFTYINKIIESFFLGTYTQKGVTQVKMVIYKMGEVKLGTAWKLLFCTSLSSPEQNQPALLTYMPEPLGSIFSTTKK